MQDILNNSAYDPIAWCYDRHWRGLCPKAMAVLGAVLLPGLPRGARVLDLCCGAGHVAGELARRGYRVTGLDVSRGLLRHARRNAPGVTFVAADARDFRLPSCFDAAVSTFDSLNHILTARELEVVFHNVFDALKPRGRFIFDLNMELAYRRQWNKWSAIIEDDNLCFVRGCYDREQRLGRTDVTVFRRKRDWVRADVTVYQRCYSRAEIRFILSRAGFARANVYRAREDLGMSGDIAIGRAYFLADK